MEHAARISQIFREHAALAEAMLAEEVQSSIVASGQLLIEALSQGHTVFVCGNGGSAADAQHFAAELVGRFQSKTRRPLPAIALTTDSSALTSIANDFGYPGVFARQVEALARPGDVLVGITTSGRSHNVLEAFDLAYANGVHCIGLVGQDKSAIAPYCREAVAIPHAETARVQEMHITVIHSWCDMIDRHFG